MEKTTLYIQVERHYSYLSRFVTLGVLSYLLSPYGNGYVNKTAVTDKYAVVELVSCEYEFSLGSLIN